MANPDQNRAGVGPDDRRLWLWWLVVTTLGFFPISAVAAFFSFGLDLSMHESGLSAAEVARDYLNASYIGLVALSFGVAGLIFGALQAVAAVRRPGFDAGRWLPATTLGAALGGTLGMFGYLVRPVLFLAMTGLAIGMAQWLVLRARSSRAGWWVLAGVIVLVPVLGGAVTGRLLIWLLPRADPLPPTPPGAQASP